MLWEVIAPILGATALSAGVSYLASDRAADAVSNAAQQGADAQLAMFNQSRADLEPYRKTGEQALYSLADLSGVPRPVPGGGYSPGRSFEASPGYQFRLSEGVKALDRSAAARGQLFSGGQLKRLSQYGQGLASDEYNNWANRIASLAGLGQVGSSQSANLATQTGGNLANMSLAGGQARASGYTGAANAANSAVGSALYGYLRYR